MLLHTRYVTNMGTHIYVYMCTETHHVPSGKQKQYKLNFVLLLCLLLCFPYNIKKPFFLKKKKKTCSLLFLPGFVVGVGAAMVRESSALMLGHYFKRRRQFVEMITMSGEGVGVALFSVILKEGVG